MRVSIHENMYISIYYIHIYREREICAQSPNQPRAPVGPHRHQWQSRAPVPAPWAQPPVRTNGRSRRGSVPNPGLAHAYEACGHMRIYLHMDAIQELFLGAASCMI